METLKEIGKIEKLEKELVGTLYAAAALSTFLPFEDVLKNLGKEGEIGKEFNKAFIRVSKGESVDKALMQIREETKSEYFKRALDILISGYSTGADISKALKSCADEISEYIKIQNQRKSILTIEKLTLLAGCILVPTILGLMLSIVSQLDFSGLDDFSISEGVIENIVLGNRIYLGFYAVITSAFLSFIDGRKNKFLIYLIFLVPITQIIFSLAQTIKV
ncbi:MAG: type II secretion system F family protein [archaeon]